MKEELDRWRSLAEELGLPPEPAESKKTVEPAAAPPAAVAEKAAPQLPETAPVPFESPSTAAPAAMQLPAAAPPPAAGAEATPAAEELAGLPPITSLDVPHLDPMLEGPSLDRLEPLEEPFESERPRGRGGRRGQRGGRRGRGERSESTGEPEGAGEAPSEAPGRRRGGRGRRPPERRPEPEPEPEEVLGDEEPIEPVEEEVDEGPEDNLADLNVPSWVDLIASLYRPER